MDSRKTFIYEVFGGRLRSELEFPELPAASGEPSWDLRIQRAPARPVDGELVGRVDVDDRVTVELRRHDAGWRLAYSDTGIFEISSDGRTLDWHPGADHDLSAARVDVLGRVLAVALQVRRNALVDLLAGERVVEQRGAHADGGRTGNHEFNRIFRRDDAALADDGNILRSRHFVNLLHF